MLKQILFVTAALVSIDASSILFLAPTRNVGTFLYLESFCRELLALKHSVTLISSYSTKTQNENFTAIVVPMLDLKKLYPTKDVLMGSSTSETQQMSRNWKISLMNSEHFLKNEKVQALIKSKDKKFDLVIADHSGHESMFAFAFKFACPLVTMGPSGYTNSMDIAMGHLTQLAHVPHQFSSYSNDMTFLQRVNNVYLAIYESFFRRFSYMSSQNELAQKYFNDGLDEPMPHIITIEKQITTMLVNNHRGLHLSRPKMSGQIDIGGAHIRPPLRLADDLNPFFEGAEHGVIIFSLGTELRSDELPMEKLEEFIEAFRGLKQRVLWKFDGEVPKNIPENVKLFKWFPQSSSLGQPKTVLFITHGGILSVEEGLHRGVPMLFIPFLGNQQRAAQQAEQRGYGKTLHLDNVTKESLTDAINSMVSNNEFKQNALKASRAFNDNPISPLREAIFWIEHSIRNKAIKSPSIQLDNMQHLLVDVAAFYFAIFASIFFIWVLVIKFVVKRYRNKEQKGKFKYY